MGSRASRVCGIMCNCLRSACWVGVSINLLCRAIGAVLCVKKADCGIEYLGHGVRSG